MGDVTLDLSGINNGQTADAIPVRTAFQQLQSAVNNLDTANLAAAAGIVDSQLASPNNLVWRTLRTQPFAVPGGSVAGDKLFAADGTMIAHAAATDKAFMPIHIANVGEYTPTGKTTTARVVAQLATNTVAPGVNFTFALYPLFSVGGGVNNVIVPALTTAVSGSGTSIGPAAGADERTVGAAFNLPSGDSYLLGLLLGGVPAANSFVVGAIDLQIHHV